MYLTKISHLALGAHWLMYRISNSNPVRLYSDMTVQCLYQRYLTVKLIAGYIVIANKVIFQRGVHLVSNVFTASRSWGERKKFSMGEGEGERLCPKV